MTLERTGYIDFPRHTGKGGFDHADYHSVDDCLYVAHTANDAVDVIDCRTDRYLRSISGLTGAAGVLTSRTQDLVFSSNRGEDTVAIFGSGARAQPLKVAVGHRPNGLAYDSARGVLLAANVGAADMPNSETASLVDVESQSMLASVAMPGRTRWTLFSQRHDTFFINIADPPCIVVIKGSQPTKIATIFDVPAAGPHGLDLDVEGERLFCACDHKRLICLDARSGTILRDVALSGAPDVVFFNAALSHLYVAIGDPGVIDVVDTREMALIDTISTEAGAHTIGFDAQRNKVHVFLPGTHRAAVYIDTARPCRVQADSAAEKQRGPAPLEEKR